MLRSRITSILIFMKILPRFALHPIHILALSLLLAPLAYSADKVLWNLNFDDLPPGEELEVTPFDSSTANPRPQVVKKDSENLLVGVATLGQLADKPLRWFKTSSKANYTPAFKLLMDDVLNSGKVVFEADLDFVSWQPPASGQPFETLLSIGVLNSAGEIAYRLAFAAVSDGNIRVSGEGLLEAGQKTPKGERSFPLGSVMKIFIEIDFAKKMFSASVNGDFLADGFVDDIYSAARGFALTDGTAIGGNYGGQSEIAIDNIKVTHTE